MLSILSSISERYVEIYSSIPQNYRFFLTLLFFSFVLAIYAGITWKFRHFLSTKNILKLNLAQYNRAEHPTIEKFLAVILYIIEYILLMPFVVFVWFSLFAIMLFILSENLPINQVLFIAAALVASIRILSYFSSTLAEEVSSLFPLTLLVIFVTSPVFFSLSSITLHLADIAQLLRQIMPFFLFTFGLEIILRLFDLLTGGNANE